MKVLEGDRRRTPRQTAAFQRPWRRVLTLAATAALVAVAAPQSAHAWWSRVSPSPSSASPFYVCPHPAHRIACALIEDPTRASHVRGPVAAGAITAGPEQQVSPALSGGGEEGGYSPEELRSAYDLPSTSAGTGQTVAVVDAFDDPSAEADLNVYRARYGIAACSEGNGCFRKVNATGGKSYPAPNRVWATEISTDLDMVSAICSSCHILLVEASSAESAKVAAAENEAVTLGATEISDSFAESSPPESPSEASAYDHPGIPIVAAGGDGGYGVVWPAANPHVIAVGGTTLHPPGSGHSEWTETVWSQTGSGCSGEPKPIWQTDGGCAGRTTNDVAAVADPNTPVSAYDSYETGSSPWLLASGTSVATPIVAAAMGLSSPYTRSFEGADALYLEVVNGVNDFYDVLSGSNANCRSYLCEAGPGYDGPSGLGSLRGTPEVPPPTSVTVRAGALGHTEATLEATVNPHGVELSRCALEYGQTTAYGSSAPCSSLPGRGTSPVGVSATVGGLSPATDYHFRIAVSYHGGAGAGQDMSFSTLESAPTVLTGTASAVSSTSASLAATVNPNGRTVGECGFEYGTTTAYGSLAACTLAPGGGQAPVAVSATATGLSPNIVYHFRVVASNHAGVGQGSDQTFTVVPKPPSAVTQPASAITDGSATLNATINPNGAPVTSCEFEFASAENFVPCTPQPGSQEGPVAVSASVGDLRPATTYLYRVVAVNASATVYGTIQTLTTEPLPPTGSAVVSALSGEPGAAVEPAAAPLTSPIAPCQPELTRTAFSVATRGSFTVSLRCALAYATGSGTITLQTVSAVGASGHHFDKRPLTLATGSFTVTPGQVMSLTLHLSAHARTLLARAHILLAHATIVTRAAKGFELTKQTTVTLRARASARTRRS